MFDVHVIILNWNGADDTISCLDSLFAQTDVSKEFIVVDNCSNDDSVKRIRASFPDVVIIENDRNLGFSGGMNVGIRFALSRGAQKLFLLNNDTIAMPGMLHHLISTFSSEIGIVAPAIFYHNQPDKIWSIGGKIHPILMELTLPHDSPVALQHSVLQQDFVTGCAMLIHSDLLNDVGLFDERFFPGYYEDLDFCLRVRRRGHLILLASQAHLLHKVSRASGGMESPRVYYLMGRNSGYYFRKHMRLWQAPFVILYRFGSALNTSIQLLLNKDMMGMAAYWNGLLTGWTGLQIKSDQHYLSYYR